MYISQDPIRLNGGIINIYAYVDDTNEWIDIFGLEKTYGNKAKKLSRKYASKLRKLKKLGKIKNTPTVVSVAVDRRTGKAYYGESGSRPTNINPILRRQTPIESHVGNRPPNNCAEYDAINKALKGGAGSMRNIDVYTVHVATGEPMQRCPNCKISTRGANIYSD